MRGRTSGSDQRGADRRGVADRERGLQAVQRIEEAAAARAAKVDTGETVIVGVNRYRLAEEAAMDILEVDNARVRSGQIARLEVMRAGRDEAP